ncbi:hypothetical protein LTR56_020465 [Elasticomyces elasticus]|nr:hypothetical protein LTR56_020465 [Elasticomyces elasticus]KAK3642696.1 hypothetical protein LTR22_015951 [Elasticomyces elasticus]KAK4910148.1 hypothetical protein LTR49_021114 [Elasticomyces elasticus]KAK5766420.1 hypothetical protein LTS12_003337 [Elasticomyces elasticus]
MAEPTRRGLGIFDLPLELRQQIYHEMLPNNYNCVLTFEMQAWPSDRAGQFHHVGGGDWEEERRMRALQAACLSHPQLDEEIRDWAGKQNYGRRFVFSPSDACSETPADLAYDKLPSIEIYLDGYDGDNVDKSATKLAMRLRAFVVMLKRYKRLPPVYVKFRQGYDSVRQQRLWCYEVDEAQYMLARLNRSGTPIVTYLLLTLLDLPRCEYACVDLLDDICSFEQLSSKKGVSGGAHDHHYMVDAFDVAERWLMGERGTGITRLLSGWQDDRVLDWTEDVDEVE